MENYNSSLEMLEQRVRNLLMESKEQYYTEYLQKMWERIRMQKTQVNLLADELEKCHQMYLKRMSLTETKVEKVSQNAEIQKTTDATEIVTAQETVVVPESPKPSETPYFNSMDSVQKSKNAEFAIGAAVLSVVGGGFILAALVMLGMTFMEGIVKGFCLYGMAVMFLLVSELLLYRKWPMLGATFSAIGIGGLYLSTIVNYLGLHNFNLWVTVSVTLGITFFVVLFSRKRDSVLYRIIGMISAYLCFFTVRDGMTNTEFLVVVGMILLMNVLCTLLPVKRAGTAVRITHMYLNTIFAFCFMLRVMGSNNVTYPSIMNFVISSLAVIVVLFVVECYTNRKNNQIAFRTGILVSFYVSLAFCALMLIISISEVVDIYENNWYCYSSAIIVGVIGSIAILVLCLGKCSGKRHLYSLLNIMTFCILSCSNRDGDYISCLLMMLIIAKVLSRKVNTTFRVNDLVITVWVSLLAINREDNYQYALFAGVICSVLMIQYWQTFYEIFLIGTIIGCLVGYLPFMLQLPIIVGILLLGMLAFNNVKRWKGKGVLLFNILALGVQVICFLRLSGLLYQNEYLTYICMLVFGVATIGLVFQPNYGMNFKCKHMIMAVFLTYMAFLLKTDVSVINSVFLMVIALVCVGIGFGVNKKSVRIYGLVLSLVVCGKLVLYDFFQAATLQKTILFFAVGVIALIIAAIYIILEKKSSVS